MRPHFFVFISQFKVMMIQPRRVKNGVCDYEDITQESITALQDTEKLLELSDR